MGTQRSLLREASCKIRNHFPLTYLRRLTENQQEPSQLWGLVVFRLINFPHANSVPSPNLLPFILHLVTVFHFKLSLSFLLCRNIVMIITNAIPMEELKIVFMILCQLVAMKIHGLVELLGSEVFIVSPSTVSSPCPSCPFVDFPFLCIPYSFTHFLHFFQTLFFCFFLNIPSLPVDQP